MINSFDAILFVHNKNASLSVCVCLAVCTSTYMCIWAQSILGEEEEEEEIKQ